MRWKLDKTPEKRHVEGRLQQQGNFEYVWVHPRRIHGTGIRCGGFNPFEKYESNSIISPSRAKNKTCIFELPPPTNYLCSPLQPTTSTFFVGATSRVPKLLWLLLPRLHPPVKKAGFRCFAAADAMDEKLGLDDPGTERKRKWSGWIKWWVRDQWIHWSNLNVMLKLQLNLRVSPSCRINGFSCFTYFIHLGYILVWKKPTWS